MLIAIFSEARTIGQAGMPQRVGMPPTLTTTFMSWNATNSDHNVLKFFLLLIKWSFKWEDQIIIIIFFILFN